MPKLPVRFVRGLRFRLTLSYVVLLHAASGGHRLVLSAASSSNSSRATSRPLLEDDWGAAKGYFKIENAEPVWDTTRPIPRTPSPWPS